MNNLTITLAQRAHAVKPSPTLAITAKAAALKALGKPIISLSVGEPDFDTPEHVKQAGIQAIREGKTRYTAVEGILELRKAIAQKLLRENQLSYQPEQILVSNGAKQSIYNAMQALLDPSDEVIIPAPYWVSYPDMVLLAGGTPVFVATTNDNRFKMTPASLSAAITPKTKMIIINSPSNPSGMAYRLDELRALGQVIEQHPRIVVLSDDIYEHILWGINPFSNIINACPSLYERTLVINGMSKAYAMTGWRIGYAAGHPELIAAMNTIQSQSTSNPCSISQYAAVEALQGKQDFLKELSASFKHRHDFLIERINKIPGFVCAPTDGAFYAFPDVRAAIRMLNIADDIAFSDHLLTHAHVACVPGTAFGAPGFIRLSYALSIDSLTTALDRIQQSLS